MEKPTRVKFMNSVIPGIKFTTGTSWCPHDMTTLGFAHLFHSD